MSFKTKQKILILGGSILLTLSTITLLNIQNNKNTFTKSQVQTIAMYQSEDGINYEKIEDFPSSGYKRIYNK